MGDSLRRSLWAPVGAALLLLGAGAAILSTSFDTPPQASVLGPVLPVNRGAIDAADISSHNSPTIVRSPVDGRKLAIANRIDTPGYSCALHVSSDGGATWSQTPVPTPKGEHVCYAPDVAFGADGTLYMSFVTLRGLGNVPNAAWVARSNDGGKTLSDPVASSSPLPAFPKSPRQRSSTRPVLGPHAFQVRLATDLKKPDRVYLTWVQASDVGLYKFTQPGNPIQSTRSDDAGVSWGRPVRVSHPRRLRPLAPTPAAGPDGELYVVHLDLGEDTLDYEGGHEGKGGPPYSGRWKLLLSRSQDGGRTWAESVAEERLVPTERFVAFIPPFPSLAVDQDSGRVYVAFHDGRLGDADVWVWSLPNDGTAWEGPVRVNDTPERDKTAQYLPELAVAPDGRLDVIYYDRRADRRNVMNEVSLQSSSDEGKSFGPRVRLSNRAFSSRIGFGSDRGLPDLGSRLGLVSTEARALAVWTDTRAGTPVSNKQDVARALVASSDPPRLSGPVKYLLRFGGLALALAGLVVFAARLLARVPAAGLRRRLRVPGG